MNTLALQQNTAAKSPPVRNLSHPGLLLQRKCACGGSASSSLTGECEECKKTHLQKKLSIGANNDPLEQEADRVADQVLASPVHSGVNATTPHIQRFTGQAAGATVTAPASVDRVLASSGMPLDPELQQDMGQRFGHDFSHVRVHTDGAAEQSAQDVHAHAYTVGHNIVFGAGRFAPGAHEGRRLLAHELTHVVQQTGANESRIAYAIGKRDLSAISNHIGGVLPHSSLPLTSQMLRRYAVPGTLDCNDVVGWLNSNSPYSPEWAQTNCNYSFNGQLRISPPDTSGGGVSLTVTGHNGLTVSVNCPIDTPRWTPSPRTNRDAEIAAWNSMSGTLAAHEKQHRNIGNTWRATVESNFRAVNFTVSGTNQADASSQVQQRVSALQQQWQADAQAAQSAIDPFTGAILTCP